MSPDVEKGVRMVKGLRVLVYALALALVGVWLFVPGSNSIPVLREWLGALWAMLHATFLGPYLPSAGFFLSSTSILTVTSAAIFPRLALIAWRSYRLVRRGKKALRGRAKALAA